MGALHDEDNVGAPSRTNPFGTNEWHERQLASRTTKERKLDTFRLALEGLDVGRAAALARDDTLWSDPDFRLFLLGTVQGMKVLKQDSDDLAVISRVFGGKHRS